MKTLLNITRIDTELNILRFCIKVNALICIEVEKHDGLSTPKKKNKKPSRAALIERLLGKTMYILMYLHRKEVHSP